MDTNKHVFDELEELKRKLQARMEALQLEYKETKDKYQSVVTTLGLLGFQTSVVLGTPSEGPFIPGFKGLTQAQALERLAKSNGGRFKMRDAKRALLDAGLIKTAKNANNILYNVIQREEGKWKRVAPGEYALVDQKGEKPLLAELATHK